MVENITVRAAVCVPEVPNYFVLEDGQSLPISAVTESGLKEIAQNWTEKLLKKADKQRKEYLYV